MKTRGIYAVRCVSSGNAYIGSSVDCRTRFIAHVNCLRRGKHHSIRLQRAWDKHGEGAFELLILEEIKEGEDLFIAEQRWIDELGAYNASPNARGRGAGFKNPHPGPSEEVRRCISQSLTGRPGVRRGMKASPETCARIGASKRGNKNRLGKRHSEETKPKISAKLRGRPSNPETIAKMQAGLRAKGRTPEHCARISAALKGREISAEWRANMAAAQRGRIRSEAERATLKASWTPERRAAWSEKCRGRVPSEETKRKVSEALTGCRRSPETRARMSEAQRKRAAERKALQT